MKKMRLWKGTRWRSDVLCGGIIEWFQARGDVGVVKVAQVI